VRAHRYCLSTSQANIEVIRHLFDSYRRGDYAEAAACLAAHIVYEVALRSCRPAGGRRSGPCGERWDGTWDELETVPEEFIDAGQHVLVTVHYSARGRGSRIKYEERLFDVYTFGNGQCVRKQEFRERSEAHEAAGLDFSRRQLRVAQTRSARGRRPRSWALSLWGGVEALGRRRSRDATVKRRDRRARDPAAGPHHVR
jgi:ketosteroid isomerase-like protein